MKILSIKNSIFVLLLLGLLGCDKDEFKELIAGPPGDVSLKFTMANDDSGELTVFPEATGASYFEVFYGDNPAEVAEKIITGQSGKHIYEEGNYTLKTIAYSISGESTEITQAVTIQFTPPENLAVDVVIDPVNTNIVTVTPTADNATLFELYFGDVDNEEATTIMAGESAVHAYAETGAYTLRVVARSASSTTLEFTQELDIIKPAVQLSLPIDFENPEINYNFISFGGAELSLIDNPDANGLNTSSKVGKLLKMAGSEVWAGGLLQLPQAIDFAAADQFSVKVWSPKSGIPVRLKVENETDAGIFLELDATTTTSNEWETLNYDFSGIDKNNSYHKVVIFMDFGTAGDDTNYYFDDFILSGETESFSLPIDFEADNVDYTFTDFGNVVTSRIDNPDASGNNTSAKVGALNKPANAEVWGGTFMQLGSPIDFETSDQLKLKVWSPKAGITVKFKVENSTNPDINAEIDVINSESNSWEDLSFDFSAIDKSQDYDRVVLFFDFDNNGDGSDYYFDGIGQILAETESLTLPLDFESENLTYAFNEFGNITASVIDNPDASGINTSAKVGTLNKPADAEVWGGTFLTLDEPIDFNSNDQLALKVWSPKSGIIVKLKVENSGNPDINAEVDVTNTLSNGWEELVYDFSSIDKSQIYDRVVVFFDFDNAGDGSDYYFDDIQLVDGDGGGGGNEDALTLPIDFESTMIDYTIEAFGNTSANVLENPDASGLNTSSQVAQLVKANGAETWGGAYLQLPDPIDLSSMTEMEIKAWSPKSGINVLLKLENATDGNTFHEVQVVNTKTDEWEVLSFDLSGIDTSKTYHKIVLFFDFGVSGDGSTYFFDDIKLK